MTQHAARARARVRGLRRRTTDVLPVRQTASVEILTIRNWAVHFENNRTKELRTMTWVPVPNTMDGDGYTQLVDHPEGAAHLGAWIALIQIASKCTPRGALIRGDRTGHQPETLARISRLPPKVFAEVIPRLLEIGWLEKVSVTAVLANVASRAAGVPHEPAVTPQDSAVDSHDAAWNGMEWNRRERKEEGGRTRTHREGSYPTEGNSAPVAAAEAAAPGAAHELSVDLQDAEQGNDAAGASETWSVASSSVFPRSPAWSACRLRSISSGVRKSGGSPSQAQGARLPERPCSIS